MLVYANTPPHPTLPHPTPPYPTPPYPTPPHPIPNKKILKAAESTVTSHAVFIAKEYGSCSNDNKKKC